MLNLLDKISVFIVGLAAISFLATIILGFFGIVFYWLYYIHPVLAISTTLVCLLTFWISYRDSFKY